MIIGAAAPQAPPKHFTDQELKEQYGIHLATRLQADADGKEAKWADIDDDEDDWAPDTIEWTDGTKVTLSHNDPAVQLAEEQAAAAAEKERQEAERRAKMPPPKPTTSVGPNAKVLKLGANVQPKQGGVQLKALGDKPSLVAKPAQPAAVRSPWASLPPVEKVTPVEINPPMHIPLPRSQQGEPFAAEPSQPPINSPAMEIAADSFTRTPRDPQSGSQGQLYNSQSGRYEPVNAGRRGSIRRDQNFRAPSVLQRPSQQDQQGPAEPSAAFQTGRSGSQQGGNRWDRRTSSTVSGGSGAQARRLSLSKGVADAQQQQMDSQPLQSPATPGAAQARPVTNGILAPQPDQDRQQPVNGTAAPQNPADLDAQREVQKQLMKEKTLLARQRRKEEEEKEAAAKKERIKRLMEAKGMSLEKEQKGKEAPEKKEPDVKQVAKRDAEPEAVEAPEKSREPSSVTVSVPAPDPAVHDSPGAPKPYEQYGMMKVHGPSLPNGLPSAPERSNEEAPKAPALDQRTATSQSDSVHRTDERLPSPMVNGDTPKDRRGPSIPGSPETRNQNLYRPHRQQPWNNVPRDAEAYGSGWPSGGMSTHSTPNGNLWGPPTHHKALGNGTFDRSIQRPTSRPSPYQDHRMQPTPQPIGPPKPIQRPRESPESGRPPFASQLPPAEDSQSIPSYPHAEPPPISQKRADVIRPIGGEQSNVSARPGSSMQPPAHASTEQTSKGQGSQTAQLSAWGNFQSTSAKEEQEKRQQAAKQHAARLAEEARTGVRHEAQPPVFNETWRQVKVDDEAGQRKVVAVAKGINHSDAPSSQHVNADSRVSHLPNQAPPSYMPGTGPRSRFFPTTGHGFQNQQRAASYTMGYNRSPSPPPPDDVLHPAYARAQQLPLVNLPFMKPKPTVKLPPASVNASSTPGHGNVHTTPLRAVSQPLVSNPSWQARINGLLGVKKPVAPLENKVTEATGFSETKQPLEQPNVPASAAVSLPSKDEETSSSESVLEVASKIVEDEEALFEEREFGSVPEVSLPTPDPTWQKAKPNKHSRKRGPPKTVEPGSKETFNPGMDDLAQRAANGLMVFISLPGMKAPRSRTLPAMNAHKNHQGGGRGQRNFSGNSKPGRGGRPRDASANFAGPKSTPSGPPAAQTQRAPNTPSRGGWSRGSNNWANQRAPQVAH